MDNKLLWVVIIIALCPIIISFISPIINKKKMKEQEKVRDEYLSKLKPGDKVIIISGIYGIIKSINNNVVKLEISRGVVIEVDKDGIMGAVK